MQNIYGKGFDMVIKVEHVKWKNWKLKVTPPDKTVFEYYMVMQRAGTCQKLWCVDTDGEMISLFCLRSWNYMQENDLYLKYGGRMWSNNIEFNIWGSDTVLDLHLHLADAFIQWDLQ